MITFFAWKRRLRNAFAVVFGAAVIAGVVSLIFGADVPDLNWAAASAKSLIDPPQAGLLAAATPLEPEPEEDAGVATQDGDTAVQTAPDAAADGYDASVPEVGPIPAPPTQQADDAMTRAHALLEDGDPWRALLAFEEASDQKPREADPLFWMGACYQRLGKYDAAQTQYRRALLVDDRHVPSIYGMADALRSNGQTKESVEWYRRYLDLSPQGEHRVAAKEAIRSFQG